MKQKQILIFVLTVLTVLGCLVALASDKAYASVSQNAEASCVNHEDCLKENVFSSSTSANNQLCQRKVCKQCTYVTVNTATCTASGYYIIKCNVCGSQKPNTQKIPSNALGHNYIQVSFKAATCGKSGQITSQCSRCKQYKGQTISPTGKHTWVVTKTVNSTCTMNGKKTFTCSVCGNTKEETINKVRHTYKEVITKEATCTQEGIKSYKCVCGDVAKTEPIPKKNHEWVLTSSLSPTCSMKGSKHYKCSRTGCNATYLEEIPKTSHSYKEVITKEATCTQEGIKSYKCVCGDVRSTVVIPRIEHQWNQKAATCDTPVVCISCGTVRQNALGHIFPNNLTSSDDMFDCYRCEKCDYTQKLEHHYEWVVTKESHHCLPGEYSLKCTNSGCDKALDRRSIQAYGEHIWDSPEADCTVERTCLLCELKMPVYSDHEWDNGVVTKEPSPTEFGIKTYRCTHTHCTKSIDIKIPKLQSDEEDGNFEIGNVLALTGVGKNHSQSEEFIEQTNNCINYVKPYSETTEHITIEDNDPIDTLLNKLVDAWFFMYNGHGDQDTSLSVTNDRSLTKDLIKDMDLSNLGLVSLMNCYSAGYCAEPEYTDMKDPNYVPSREKYQDYFLFDSYQESLAYLFCERGAKIVIASNIAADDAYAKEWHEQLTKTIIPAAWEAWLKDCVQYEDNSRERQEEVFLKDYLLPRITTGIDISYRSYCQKKHYDSIYYQSIVIFSRINDEESGAPCIQVTFPCLPTDEQNKIFKCN